MLCVSSASYGSNALRLRLIAVLERIWIVGSMNPATTMGRQTLAPRLAALMNVAYMSYPSPDDLLTIYSDMLARSLHQVKPFRVLISNFACLALSLSIVRGLPTRLMPI